MQKISLSLVLINYMIGICPSTYIIVITYDPDLSWTNRSLIPALETLTCKTLISLVYKRWIIWELYSFLYSLNPFPFLYICKPNWPFILFSHCGYRIYLFCHRRYPSKPSRTLQPLLFIIYFPLVSTLSFHPPRVIVSELGRLQILDYSRARLRYVLKFLFRTPTPFPWRQPFSLQKEYETL